MSSDRRWTGGAANREWQRGTAPRAEEVMSAAARQVIRVGVKRYLDDCARFRSLLRGPYHPSEAGMLRVVWTGSAAARAAAAQEYREMTNGQASS